MSAFMVSKEHIAAMLHFLRYRSKREERVLRIYGAKGGPVEVGPWNDDATWVKAGQIMVEENRRALRHRYSNPSDMLDSDFSRRDWAKAKLVPAPRSLTPVEAIKAAQCFTYQCAEPDDYRETVAYHLADSVIDLAISLLPGYDAAPWSLDHFPLPAKKQNLKPDGFVVVIGHQPSTTGNN
jgi:hypothetical protein